MQTYTVFCPLNTTEDKFRADYRGEIMVSLQVDDVMFRRVPGAFSTPRHRLSALQFARRATSSRVSPPQRYVPLLVRMTSRGSSSGLSTTP